MMARPREFDTEVALQSAMSVFWAKGYRATSLNDLTRAMGISKSSFYETFGAKHDLFLQTLAHYDRTVVEALVGRLESESPVLKVIGEVFNAIVDGAAVDGDRRGCFVANCASELALHDPDAAERIADGFARLEGALFRAVQRGQVAGEISAESDARAMARFLIANVNGLRLMAKADAGREALADVVRITMSVLER